MIRAAASAFLLSALTLPFAAAGADKPAAATEAAAAAGFAPYTYVIGPFEPVFTAPAPGSYTLPPIDDIGDHALVDAAGKRTTLAQVLGDRLAVVSFIYGTCHETAGCPLSNAVLQRVDRRVVADPEIASDVALVTISFDPEHDTPARLAAMQAMRAQGSTWRFLTAPDSPSLEALLRDFGQTVTRLRNTDGSAGTIFRHVLKVFLVDRRRRVRNIYSVGLMHPDLVWNDLVTLRLEGGR